MLTYRNWEDVNNSINYVSNLGITYLKHGFPIGVLCISYKKSDKTEHKLHSIQGGSEKNKYFRENNQR